MNESPNGFDSGFFFCCLTNCEPIPTCPTAHPNLIDVLLKPSSTSSSPPPSSAASCFKWRVILSTPEEAPSYHIIRPHSVRPWNYWLNGCHPSTLRISPTFRSDFVIIIIIILASPPPRTTEPYPHPVSSGHITELSNESLLISMGGCSKWVLLCSKTHLPQPLGSPACLTLLNRNCRTLIGLVVNKLRFVIQKRTCTSSRFRPVSRCLSHRPGMRFLFATEPEH